MRGWARPEPYRRRLRADSTFWFELQFCNEHGIPHSFFLGTEVLQWEPEDRLKAMAFLQEKALRCQLCGTAEWEWAENRHAYEALPTQCEGCRRKEFAAAGEPQSHGVTYELRSTQGVEAARRRVAQRRASGYES